MIESLLTATRPLPEPPVVPVLLAVPADGSGLSHRLCKGAWALQVLSILASGDATIGSGSIPAEGMLVKGWEFAGKGQLSRASPALSPPSVATLVGAFPLLFTLLLFTLLLAAAAACVGCGVGCGVGLGVGEGL